MPLATESTKGAKHCTWGLRPWRNLKKKGSKMAPSGVLFNPLKKKSSFLFYAKGYNEGVRKYVAYLNQFQMKFPMAYENIWNSILWIGR